MMKIFILLALSINLLFASVAKLTALKGDVSVFRASKELTAKVGMALEEKDKIVTKIASKAQMIFKDKTVITIGKNSSFSIHEYLYEPKAKKASAKFGASRGFFKAITGAIGKINPDKFALQTKTSTIGIRGTHFFGMMDDKQETIGCTQGAIVVSANGVSVDVLAGEVTVFNYGDIPEPPRQIDVKDIKKLRGALASRSIISSKIAQLKVKQEGGKITFDKQKVGEILESIRTIKDADVRSAAEDELQRQLYSEIDKIEDDIKVAAEVDVGYTAKDGHIPVTWGYTPEKKMLKTDTGWSVEGKEYASLNEAFIAAVPDSIWVRGEISKPETLNALIGQDAQGTLLKHYDGRVKSKEVVRYVGKILGFISANNAHTLIEQDETNQVVLQYEFANRYYKGTMQFNAKDPQSGELKNWAMYLNSTDPTAVTEQSFANPTFIPVATTLLTSKEKGEGETKVSSPLLYDGRYFGDKVNQISANFIIDTEDGNEANGLFVVNRDESGSYKLVQNPVAKNEYFSWGYWSTEDDVKAGKVSATTVGGWMIPNEGIELSSAELIESYKTNSIKVSYAGEVIGTVRNVVGNIDDIMHNGKVALDFDFARGSATGSLSFDAAKEAWKIGVDAAEIVKNGFTLTQMSAQSGSDVELFNFSGGGNFYGKNAEAVGGGFKLTSTAGKNAIGAFVGSK